MFFAPEALAGILLSGSDQIALVVLFLPRCGAMMFCVDCLFVIRSAVQGLGRPMLPMVSGILEMILRIAVISLFIGRIGFAATAYAEIGAWIGALIVNAYALYIGLAPRLRQSALYANKKEVLRGVSVLHFTR